MASVIVNKGGVQFPCSRLEWRVVSFLYVCQVGLAHFFLLGGTLERIQNMNTTFHAKLFDKLVDVGEPRFNLAHERLFNIIIDADKVITSSSLVERTLAQEEWDALSGAFDELVTYAKTHFAEEEEYLVMRGYPDAQQHQMAHHTLIEELNVYQKKVMQGDEANLKEMRRWLLEWLLNHVNHQDYAYAQYFAGQ